jgi:spore maturation protein CgeB
VIFSINFIPDLARLAKAVHKPYLCWIIDPLVNVALLNSAWASEYTHIFEFSPADAERFKQAGYTKVYGLPLTVDYDVSANDRPPAAKPDYGIAFVGNCYEAEASAFQAYRQQYLQHSIPPQLGLATLERVIERAVENLVCPLRALFLETIEREQPAFFEQAPLPSNIGPDIQQRTTFFVDHLLYHEIDRRVRTKLMQKLAPLGVDLWGTEKGWQPVFGPGIQYHGQTDSAEGPGEILQNCAIGLNITRRITDGANMRTFEIAARGGFQLSLYSDQLARLFKVDEEVVCFKTFDEAYDKAAYYLNHPEERQKIASAAQARYRQEHSFAKRCAAIEQVIRNL